MSDALDVREHLYALQQNLLQRANVVVQIGLNTPGGFSLYPWQRLFAAASAKVKQCLIAHKIPTLEQVSIQTAVGPYSITALRTDGFFVKAALVAIEESHPQGRLWDLDVITAEGGIDRAALGLAPRKCLLCSHPAHECRKLAKHPYPDIIAAAQQIARGEGRSDS